MQDCYKDDFEDEIFGEKFVMIASLPILLETSRKIESSVHTLAKGRENVYFYQRKLLDLEPIEVVSPLT